jgi:hypothetical protein
LLCLLSRQISYLLHYSFFSSSPRKKHNSNYTNKTSRKKKK